MMTAAFKMINMMMTVMVQLMMMTIMINVVMMLMMMMGMRAISVRSH